MNDSELPDFTDPPLKEVAIGVQFQPLPNFTQAGVGYFWNKIRSKYPKTQDQPRLESQGLEFGLREQNSFQIEILGSAPIHRAWFTSADDQDLLQIQEDRLIHNWRYNKATYPHFPSLLERFLSDLQVLEAAANELDIAPVCYLSAEVTYVNWIQQAQSSGFLEFGPDLSPALGLCTNQSWAGQFSMTTPFDAQANLIARKQPGLRSGSEMEEGVGLTLTYQAQIQERSQLDAVLLAGRQAIDSAFLDLTNDEMQASWGRTQ